MKYAWLLLLLTGCPLNREKFDRTPNGWHVHWLDSGTIATGLHTKPELFALFDAAMERSFPECAAKVGLPESYVRSKIRENDALYTLVDNFYFPIVDGIPAVDAPSALFASGETLNRLEVWIAFYNKAPPVDFRAQVPKTAPPWTIKAGVSLPVWYYGEELDGMQYPALGYEQHWQFTEIP